MFHSHFLPSAHEVPDDIVVRPSCRCYCRVRYLNFHRSFTKFLSEMYLIMDQVPIEKQLPLINYKLFTKLFINVFIGVNHDDVTAISQKLFKVALPNFYQECVLLWTRLLLKSASSGYFYIFFNETFHALIWRPSEWPQPWRLYRDISKNADRNFTNYFSEVHLMMDQVPI